MRWSVSLLAEGDRVIELEEVVELADAVAVHDGVATGMGTYGYGAQLVVEAGNADEAVELAVAIFNASVAKAGLPVWPIVEAETVAEDEEIFYGVDDEVEPT
jgi:hypothetical protein